MERALRNGELSMERVDEAVRRVRRVRAMCRAFPEDLSPGQREEDRREAERVSLNSITAVRLHGEMPVLGPDTLYAGSYAARSTLASSSVDRSLSFPHFLAERLGGTPLVTPIDPNPEEIEKVLAAAASLRCRNAVVGLYNGQFNRGELSLVGALCEAGLRVAAVSLRNPYDLSMADERADAFAAYEYTELAFGSLVRLFRERKRPEGKLSVRL
jgi:beta-N-acetylhexosaminidase